MRAISKRSQVTIFIIIAIIIVGGILIFFAVRNWGRIQNIFVPSSPSIQLQNCVDKQLSEAIMLVEEHGGSISPIHYYLDNGNKIEYLCYTNQYYQTCVMQQPMLKQHIEAEILNYSKEKIMSCYNNLKTDLESKGYSVSQNKEQISISIIPNSVRVNINGITITKEQSESYDSFNIDHRSKLYDLIMMTNSILNWEARMGDSEIMQFMMYYPNVKVEKLKQEDGSKIYILTHESGDTFTFATRSLSWPGGFDFGTV